MAQTAPGAALTGPVTLEQRGTHLNEGTEDHESMMADHMPQSQESQDMVEDGHEDVQDLVPLDNAVAQDTQTRPANEPQWKQTVRLAVPPFQSP